MPSTLGNETDLTGADRVIHSVDVMHRILERERARADRTRCPFALIVMTFNKELANARILSLLDSLLAERLRLTDDAGFLDGKRLGLILGNTREGGAWKVLRDICRSLPEGWKPSCEVFVYPSIPAPFADTGEGNAPQRGSLNKPAPEASRFYIRPLPIWKRMMDLVLAFAVLALAAPVLALSALAIKLTSRGPVFFKQRRAGLGGRPFTIYKLRTMVCDAESKKDALRKHSEQDGPAFKIRNDPRVTMVGRFLRKSCIDELPQLLNVIRGEMSIVGPRPLPIDEAEACQNWEKRRLDVTPGLTCIWQVRGALRVSFADWMRMDIRYIKRRNVFTDAKLMVQTAFAVLLHRASC